MVLLEISSKFVRKFYRESRWGAATEAQFLRGHSPEEPMIIFLCRVKPDSRVVLRQRSVVFALSCVELNPRLGANPCQVPSHVT